MKKGTSDLHQSPADELAKAKLDTQISLNQYLERLKESVSKKRKLKTLKKKRDTLLAQVKFLRRRRYLLKHQHSNSQNSNVDRSLMEGKRNVAPFEAASGKNSILRHYDGVGGRGKEDEIVQKALRVGKSPKSYSTNDNRIDKKKIMW